MIYDRHGHTDIPIDFFQHLYVVSQQKIRDSPWLRFREDITSSDYYLWEAALRYCRVAVTQWAACLTCLCIKSEPEKTSISVITGIIAALVVQSDKAFNRRVVREYNRHSSSRRGYLLHDINIFKTDHFNSSQRSASECVQIHSHVSFSRRIQWSAAVSPFIYRIPRDSNESAGPAV